MDRARGWPAPLVPLPVTLGAHLRATDLPRLRASGPLGELLARQGEAHGRDFRMGEMGRLHAGLPDDLLNFQYDPVACAVAIGWPGAIVEQARLQLVRGVNSSGSGPGLPAGPCGCWRAWTRAASPNTGSRPSRQPSHCRDPIRITQVR
jgi:hypothetical protein